MPPRCSKAGAIAHQPLAIVSEHSDRDCRAAWRPVEGHGPGVLHIAVPQNGGLGAVLALHQQRAYAHGRGALVGTCGAVIAADLFGSVALGGLGAQLLGTDLGVCRTLLGGVEVYGVPRFTKGLRLRR